MAKVHPKLIQINYFIFDIALDFPYWKNQRQLLCSDIIVPATYVAVYFMPFAGLFVTELARAVHVVLFAVLQI